MNDDWLSKLSALRDSMPDDPAEESSAEETLDDKPEQKAVLDISLDRKGRAGKTATIITGFTIDDKEIAILASKIKQQLATGGSSRGGEILIQGDRRKEVFAFLKSNKLKARII